MKASIHAGALALMSALALAACGGEASDTDGDGTISGAEMQAEADRAGASVRPEPGKYSVTMSFVKAEIPGAPKEMQDMMGSMMNQSFEYCLTQEEAEKGYEEALTEGQDDSCNITRFELDGGDIDMAMSCAAGEGDNMDVTMTGNVTPTRSEINVVSDGTLPGVGDANIEMSMVQERIGDCD